MDFNLTRVAQKFISLMLRLNGGTDNGLRLVVAAAGCSGLAAQFDVEPAPRAGDAVFEKNGLRFFLPAESRLLLDGVTVDFAETPTQGGLVFHDHKSANCGCKTAGAAASVPIGEAHAP